MKRGPGLLFSLFIAACSYGIAAQTTECENATVADIVFLVDGSSSISPQSFQEVRNFLRNIIRAVDIGPGKVRIGLAQYSDEPHQEFLLKDHKDRKSLLNAVEKMTHRGGGTETGKAIDFLLKQCFTEAAGSRANQRVPQVAVVITDGESTDSVAEPAQSLRDRGILVFAIGVGEANEQELQSIANEPPHHFVFTIDDYPALETIRERLLQTVCNSVEALAETYADVFFLVDSGIPAGPLSLFKSELSKLIKQINVGASAHRIGLAQYAEDTKVEFLLSAFQTKQETLNGVQRFRPRPQPNQPHNLGRALQYANTQFFTREAGGRAHLGYQQFLIVVSGKDSDDPVHRAAYLIQSAGINVVGMSAGAPRTLIDLISSYPRYAFDDVRVTLLKTILTTVTKENVTEDCKGANVADIVFIVDESGSIGPTNFQLVRNFLHSVVSGLNVSRTRVRVGIVTYETSRTAHIYLDTSRGKAEILQYISILPYKGGGTATGAALNFTHDEIFIERRGRRKGVQQVAVVITDGESQDSVSEAAIRLRRAGVTIYSVGIKDAKLSELEAMASYPTYKHVFNIATFTGLKLEKQRLQKSLCSNIIDETTTDKIDIKQACEQKDDADIFFLMDDSGSIGNIDFEDMQQFIIKFINNFHIGQNHVRVGLVKYSDDASVQIEPTTHADAKTLAKAVKNIFHAGGGTNTGKALEFMVPQIEKAKITRGHKVPEYLIVITDGESMDDVTVPAEKLRAKGVTIYAIGVKDSNQKELEDIAGDPKKTFLVNNFDALKSLSDGVTRDICSPDACKGVPLDIIFLADSSGSISDSSYKKMTDFIKAIVSKSVIGQNEVHIGLMQFSTLQKLEFSLNSFYSKDEILKAIDDMQQMNENTLTGEAITKVSQYFEKTEGGRPELGQRLVIITDGKAQDEVKGPAEALRAKGVVIYAIGVGDANTAQLEDLSGSSDKVFYERDFDALKELESQLVLKLCEDDCKKIQRADIIFLVDGSTSIDSTEFTNMQTFMKSIVNRTTVGKDQTHFGVIVYANKSESVFPLKKYESKQDVLNAITNVKAPTGNTYTSQALKDSLKYFGAEHGGRKALKVPQILMVITDGEATDPHDLKTASDKLRENKITVFSIGVEKADRKELETMAGDDASKVFYVDNFVDLETLHKNISSVLCNSTKPVCEKDKADVVFLLDRSSSITPDNYTIMINFTAQLVNSLDVSEGFVHVGVAQFSDDPKDEFYLNKYSKKEHVMAHIEKMKYAGGNTYLGKALDHMKRYFEVLHGSRLYAWIPQNLVLITDGDSHDDVEDAANDLRALGVEVFAIGVGDVHDLQLLQIAGNPERLFSVRNFNNLVKIKQKVIDAMCGEEPPVTEGCTIDIAMGFDISRRTRAPGQMLVSGHTKLQTFLPEIARYLSSVEGLCCVDPKLVETKISYHVLDRTGQSLYDTNFEGYSEDVLKKVMAHPVSENTYFNSAMLTAFKGIFQAKSKANVKVLVIFSDGLDEDVMKLEQESELLHQSGVSALLTVALEGARNPAQLQMVEFGRGFAYHLPLSIGMPNVGSTIFKQINTVSDRVCCNVTCKCSGHEGPRGSPGTPGTKGSRGQKGQPGFLGEEGVSGERGPPGPSGPSGLQGCPGVSGLKGNRGISGNRGENGEDGLDGVDGEQGVTGPGGDKGERGHPGNPGIPGIRGQEGLKGQRGLRGDPGEPGTDNTVLGAKGDPGNPGLVGAPGPDGRPGERGVGGNQGPDGRRGRPGVKAAPGEPGARGLPGSPGAAGPQGRRGPNGELGPKGISGFPGPQGEHGAAGDPGVPGRRGPNGQKGQPGDRGVKGSPGSLGPRGMPGQDGRDGYGPPGTKGAKGDPGFPGYPGKLGEDGLKGTKGYPGRRGNHGRSGNSGRSGIPGVPGEPGDPGHRGPRGPPGGREYSECELVTLIRDNCACSPGGSECPTFPTELVFGLDMSEDVTPAAFERQRAALLSLLEDITISESNCPTAARVAVVGYSGSTKYLIRFHDYHRKKQLIESVKSIALERTSNRRQLGASMRFVGHNTFKHVRAGKTMRKVAVFFSGGVSQDSNDIVTAMMEYQALRIFPVVIALRNAPGIARAMEVDDSRNFVFTVLGRDPATDLRRVKNCAICYDPCKRPDVCGFIQPLQSPQEVDVDLVMVVDSSRQMQADEYAGAQQLLGSVVEQLAVSSQPRRAGTQARVAVVQQSGTRAPKVEFGLQTYQDHNAMRRHLIQNMQQQGGSSALGQTLEYTLREVLLKATQPRRRRALLTVVGTETTYADRAKLQYISQKAKCEGVALFVVTVGNRYSQTQVEQLASLPVQQHLIHVDRLKADEQGYAQRFFRVFLSALNKGMNTYPPPSLRQTCSQLPGQDEGQILIDSQRQAQLEEVGEEVEEEVESFQEQTRGQTQTGQLDIIETLTRGDSQTVVLGANLNAQCQLDADAGIQCQDYVRAWYYDKHVGACFPFWYGGCGGNANRFNTENECFQTCGINNPDILPTPQLNGFASKDDCFLRQDPGSCQNYTMMWFFDTEQNECSRFWYGGCGGNENRFKTQEECENLCLTKSR